MPRSAKRRDLITDKGECQYLLPQMSQRRESFAESVQSPKTRAIQMKNLKKTSK